MPLVQVSMRLFPMPVAAVNRDTGFLLPCACSARIRVVAGQAGDRVACPRCGTGLDVPRLSDLLRLEPAGGSTPPTRGWDVARGLLVAGTSIALLAGAAAVAVAVGGRGAAPDPEAIRAAVASASAVDVLRAWQSLAASGVARPPTALERRQQAFAAASSGIATALWSVAGFGAAVAGGAAVLAYGGRGRGAALPRPVGRRSR